MLEPFLDKTKTEFFSSAIESAMKELFPHPPHDSLEPENIWEEKKRKEVLAILSGQAAIDKSIAGFDAIAMDLKHHLKSAEMEKISKEWELGVQAWMAHAKLKEQVAPLPKSLMEVIGISEETLNHFYHSANRHFQAKDYKAASDAFYVIAGLDPNRFNVWMALGLSEAHTGRYEPALISFSIASLLDSKAINPYLFSAECCIKNNQIDEAKAYIKLASDAVHQSALKDKQPLQDSIQKLTQMCK